MHVLCLGYRLVASLQRERKPSIDAQNAEQNENPSSKELFPMHVRHVPLPSVQSLFEKSSAPVFRDNRDDGICLEKSMPTALLF